MRIDVNQVSANLIEVLLVAELDVRKSGEDGLDSDYVLAPNAHYGIYLMPDLTLRAAFVASPKWMYGKGKGAILLATFTTDEFADIDQVDQGGIVDHVAVRASR